MARRGSYGQLPRAAPSLASTIVAIAQAFQAQRESNLMDAWKNGGTFEGRPVTDDEVLAFWRGRLGEVAKNDPAYDNYSNTVDQLEYSISESKMSTWYAQSEGGPKDDRRMADFYSTWSKKIPPESEFYRVLQRDAAQFIRAAIAKEKALAKSGGGGGGGGGGPTKAQLKAKAYNDAQAKTAADYELPGKYLTNVFNIIAKAKGLVGVKDTEDITDFDPSDPSRMLEVLDQINNSPNSIVYYNGDGAAITGAAILAGLKNLDPHFSGTLTTDYYGQALRGQLQGTQRRLDLAYETAHKGDITSIGKELKVQSELGRQANAWGAADHYQTIRGLWLQTWLDPTASPDSKVAATREYFDGLAALATDKKQPLDDNSYNRIVDEINGNGSVDSWAENFSGLSSGDHSSVEGGFTGDIADTHRSLEGYLAQQQAVASGQAVWAFGSTSNGVFTPGLGNEIGAASPLDVQRSGPEGAIQVYVTQGNGAPPIPVWVAGRPVEVEVRDPDGVFVPSINPDSVRAATAYDVIVDGQATRLYAYAGPGGTTVYTTDAPWGANSQEHDDGAVVRLEFRLSQVPSAENVGRDSIFTVKYRDDGSVSGISIDPGRFALARTDPVRYAAGPDPNVDSLSPTTALYLAPNRQDDLTTLRRDTGFRAQVERELWMASGGTYDEAGRPVGGDPRLYREGVAQADRALLGPRAGTLTPAQGDIFFQRNSTNNATVGRADVPTGLAEAPARAAVPASLLPSDAVRGTQLFGGLADAFRPGSNRFVVAPPEPLHSISIQAPTALRVPAMPQTSIQPAPIPAAPLHEPTGPAPVPVAPTPAPSPILSTGDRLEPTPIAPPPAPVPAPSPILSTGDRLEPTPNVIETKTKTPPVQTRTGMRPV